MPACVLHPHFSTVDIILEIHMAYNYHYLQEVIRSTLAKITLKRINFCGTIHADLRIKH